MFTLTQEGVVSSSLLAQLNSNFSEVTQGSSSGGTTVDFWVRPQAGVGDADGSYAQPFGSMALVRPYMEPGVVIGLEGVLREEFSTPLGVNDVTLLGARSNKPRQATTSGVPNGGGATWMSPSSGGANELLILRSQGWKIENIFFSQSTAAKAAIQILRAGDGPTEADAEHTSIIGCGITGTKYGIEAKGLPNFCIIAGNYIYGLGDSGDVGLQSTTGAGIGTLQGWSIVGNRFFGNAGHIVGGFAAASIDSNVLTRVALGVTTTNMIILTNGANNNVTMNRIQDAVTGATGTYAGGTNDVWVNLYADDGLAAGVPS